MRIVLFGLLTTFALQVSRAEVSYIPETVRIGGGILNRVYFQDGARKFSVTIDGETSVVESDGGALFRFEKITQASMRLRKSPLNPTIPFEGESLKAYEQSAMKCLPGSAGEISLVARVKDPLPVNGWTSSRFVYSYRIGGIAYFESFTFLNLDDRQQMLIQTGAPDREAAAVAARADDTIRRWSQVLPGDDEGSN